jgi:cytoskeletal protein CcmA (bactofilin family)
METPGGKMEMKDQGIPQTGICNTHPIEGAPAYIGPGIKVKGTIIADEDLYIDGDVEGSVSVPGHRLTVGEMAYISAETVAREVVVYGALQGELRAFDRTEIKRHGSVAGDVATAQIVIEDGAHFKGVIAADGLRRRLQPEP